MLYPFLAVDGFSYLEKMTVSWHPEASLFFLLYKKVVTLDPLLAKNSSFWYLLAVNSLVQLLGENECLMAS